MSKASLRLNHRHALSRRLLLGSAALAAACSAHAQSTWTGAVSQDWNTVGNWSSSPSNPTGNFIVNTATGNYPVVSATSTLSPVDIFIGQAGGTGRLDQTAGTLAAGAVNWSFVGNGLGSTGTYNLGGTGSFTSGRLLVAQDRSTGTMNINTTGTLTTSAAGVDWWNSSGVVVGIDGGSNATLNLQAGTIATTGTNANLWVGALGGNGTLNQTGGTINLAGGLSLARYWGTGAMTVSNGTVNAASVNVTHAGAAVDLVNGTLTLNNGAVVNSAGDVAVAFAGSAASQATLNVNTGAVLNIGTTAERWMIVNQWDTVKGAVNVNGGTVNLNGNTDLRFSTGNGTGASAVNLNSGAITSWSGNQTGTTTTGVLDLNFGGGASANNTFNLNGGTLTVNQVLTTSNNGSATLNLNGGTLKAAGNTTAFVDLGGASQAVNVLAGGAIIDTNGFNVAIPQALLNGGGGGGLVKNGAGTLTLSGANTFTGDITVNGGTLSLNSAFVAADADFNLVNGAVVDLNFSGTNIIAQLFINGAAQANGTYGAIGSGATYQLASFTGTGWLGVTASAIPEPSAFAAFGGIAALALAGSRRRRSTGLASK